MADWFSIISVGHIFIFLIGFIIGRFWRLGKKIINQVNNPGQENG